MDHKSSPPLFGRLDKRRGLWFATFLIGLVALLDYATGYEIRLSVLYLIPIAMVTWVAGFGAGTGVALAATIFWWFSFRTTHFYLHPAYYFWEAVVLLMGFLALIWVVDRLRRAVFQADERFFRLLEAMQPGVMVCDEQRHEVLYANPAMSQISGGGRLSGWMDWQTHFNLNGPDASEPASRGAGFSPRTVRDPVGGAWYLFQHGPIPWGSNPAVSLTVLTDISAQKQAEAFREKHIDMIHQSARQAALAEIAATLAHEINQPLMVIATYTDACQRLLAMDPPDMPEIAKALEKCHAQAVRAATIIERLREFIRQRKHQPEPCDLRQLILESVEAIRPMLDDQAVSIDMDGLAPGLSVQADRTLLIQLFVNLIRNAVEAMADRAERKRLISIAGTESEPQMARITVSDSGPGIAEGDLEQIFKPFFTTRPQGLGLGLAICRTVAQAHGGRLWAETSPGGGACFVMTLPLFSRTS